MFKKTYSTPSHVATTFRYLSEEAKRNETNLFVICLEIMWLFVINGIGPNYYIQAGLANKTVSWSFKKSLIGNTKYHKALAILNPIFYRKITQNKVAEKAFFIFSGIKCVKALGFLHAKEGFVYSGGKLCSQLDLETLLKQEVGKKVCFKTPEGCEGNSFKIGKVIILNKNIFLEGVYPDRVIALNEYFNAYVDKIQKEGILLEKFVEQRSDFSNFNASSVNTFRVWVLDNGKDISVIGAYLRIGRENSIVDNAAQGGIMCPVDISTGTLGGGITTSTPIREEFDVHPDNGEQLLNIKINGWNKVVDLSCETLRVLPYTRFVGVDIAMTDEGPIVIEANVCPDKNGAANGKIRSNLLQSAAEHHQKYD